MLRKLRLEQFPASGNQSNATLICMIIIKAKKQKARTMRYVASPEKTEIRIALAIQCADEPNAWPAPRILAEATRSDHPNSRALPQINL
jgi:hypothetical protein